MINVILILILVLIVGLAAGYLYQAKKSGKTCIGCPHAGQCGTANGGASKQCSGNCGSCSGCSMDASKQNPHKKSE